MCIIISISMCAHMCTLYNYRYNYIYNPIYIFLCIYVSILNLAGLLVKCPHRKICFGQVNAFWIPL